MIAHVSRRRALIALGALGAGAWSGAIRARDLAQRTAIVVGAGIAGLSAAYVLQRSGFRVRVLESLDAIGGRMRDAWTGPLYGPVHAAGIFDNNAEMYALARELRIEERLQGPEVSYPIDNGFGRYPMGLRFRPTEAASIPGMSPAARDALAALGRDFVPRFEAVDPCQLDTGADLDLEPIPEYVRRFADADAAREIVDYAIAPVVEGWGTPVAEASTVAFFASFARQSARFVHPNASIGALPEALASRLNVETGATVMRVGAVESDGRRTVTYLAADGRIRRERPDVVIAAVPAPIARALLDGLDPAVDDALRGAEFAKYAHVDFILSPDAAPSRAQYVRHPSSHPDPLRRRIASWGVMPAGPGPHARPPIALIELSIAELHHWQALNVPLHVHAFPLLQALYPPLRWEHVRDVVFKGGDYVPYQRVGFARRARAALARQARERASLYVAGEALAGAHTGAACASGVRVAGDVVRHWLA